VQDDDLIAQAFEDVMEGRRKSWSLDQSPFSNLCLIVRSLASNELKRRKKDAPIEAVQNSPSVSHSQVQILEDREQHQVLTSRLKKAAEGDPLLEGILCYVIPDRRCKTSEIAAALGVSPREIHNARKRLRRKLATSQEILLPGDNSL
jgi:DNA-directed RNA polymerase specialized sigma24 family protein